MNPTQTQSSGYLQEMADRSWGMRTPPYLPSAIYPRSRSSLPACPISNPAAFYKVCRRAGVSQQKSGVRGRRNVIRPPSSVRCLPATLLAGRGTTARQHLPACSGVACGLAGEIALAHPLLRLFSMNVTAQPKRAGEKGSGGAGEKAGKGAGERRYLCSLSPLHPFSPAPCLRCLLPSNSFLILLP